MSAQKTEKATEERKKKSRERGEGVRSRELTSAAGMLAGLLLLRGASSQFLKAWTQTYTLALVDGSRPFDSNDGLNRLIPGMLMPSVAPLLLVLAASLVAAVAVGALQSGGIQIRPATLAWKPSRLSPGTNIKNVFSARSLLRLFKSLLPAAGVVMLASYSLRGSILPLPVTSYARLPLTLSAAYSLAVDAAWISLAWAALDYVNEWRQWNQGLRMTKEEVKQEFKQSNGNPHIKGRIRQIQRAMRKRRVKADVSRAAVVITNPTHYAVALLFDFESMAAPRLLTKGRDLHAFEIREEARWAGVPIVENPPLARSLYRAVNEGEAIPYELYTAVAAILAFLFRQNAERARRDANHASSHGYGYSAPPRVMVPLVDHLPPSESERR